MSHTLLALALAALGFGCIACAEHPTTPSLTSAEAAPTALGEPRSSELSAASGSSAAAASNCTPQFKRAKSKCDDMFPLTITFPSGCRWSARHDERGSIAWWLTNTASNYKTHRYDDGVTAVGAKTVGIFYGAERESLMPWMSVWAMSAMPTRQKSPVTDSATDNRGPGPQTGTPGAPIVQRQARRDSWHRNVGGLGL